MTRGINRAEPQALYEASSKCSKCIFISHKSEDAAAAKTVADHIRDAGIDVYLDIYDTGLQKATQENDASSIVRYIERALTTSTNILVLITEKTQLSWWVPYEIGYSKMGSKGIASLLLKNAYSFPDYLKIERQLRNKGDLDAYIAEVSRSANTYGYLKESQISNLPSGKLLDYIRG